MTLLAMGIRELYLDWDIVDAHILFQDAATKSPSFLNAWHELAVTSTLLGEFQTAVGSIQKALEIDPGSVQEQYHAGWFYMAVGDYENALYQCQKSIEIAKDHSFSYKCAAESALELGLNEQAKRYILETMELYGASESDLAEIKPEIDAGNYSVFYEWIYKLWSSNNVPFFFLASVKASAGDYDNAKKYVTKAFQNREPYIPLILAQPEFKPLLDSGEVSELLKAIRTE